LHFVGYNTSKLASEFLITLTWPKAAVSIKRQVLSKSGKVTLTEA